MKLVFFSILQIFSICALWAQKETYNWTFGLHVGLSWKEDKLRSFPGIGVNGNPDMTLYRLPGAFKTFMWQIEGSSSISDSNGDLLFYSNGRSVFDITGKQLTTSLSGGISSAQSCIIIPHPKGENKYICIGINHLYRNEMSYAIIRANSPQDVKVDVYPMSFQFYTGKLSENVAAVRHANGVDWWIVAPGTNPIGPSYMNAFLANTERVRYFDPVVTPTGIDFTNSDGQNNGTMGYLKFTINGKHFAWLTATEGKLIYGDFDNSTGKFSNMGYLNIKGYGLEFSPDQKYIYVTYPREYSNEVYGLYVYELAALLKGDKSYRNYFRTPFNIEDKGPYAVQMDPQGNLWITANGDNTSKIYFVDNPYDPDELRVYRLDDFFEPETYARIGLPTYPSAFFRLLGDPGICINVVKEYSVYISEKIGGQRVDYLKWNWGDNSEPEIEKLAIGGEQKKKHSYSRSGLYTISVEAYDENNKLITSPQKKMVKVNPCVMPINPNIHMIKNIEQN